MLIRISRRVEEIHTHPECADTEGTQRSGSGHAPSQSLFWFCPSFPSDLRLGEEHSEYLQSSLSTGAQVSGASCKIQCSHAFDSHPQVQTSLRIRCQSKLTQNPRPPGLCSSAVCYNAALVSSIHKCRHRGAALEELGQ